ncbi:MAG: methyltransferase domain-containing protein [Candidatus Doudnabacteria bacterium]|nr:methyltransferase domain-containing protein [Candidatus Doudnabacteria bacterium]
MKLHLGCGKRYIPGFVHVDWAKFSHIDYRHRIDKLPMFKTNSADLIYCSHTFEYFDRVEAQEVLKEWSRVLKRGGVLHLAVPDWDALLKVYKKYQDLRKILGPLYGRWPISGSKKIIYHKTVYNFQDLKKLLKKNGFIKVRRYDWRKTIHQDYDDYSQAYIPHMDKKHGTLISLNVEAVKK